MTILSWIPKPGPLAGRAARVAETVLGWTRNVVRGHRRPTVGVIVPPYVNTRDLRRKLSGLVIFPAVGFYGLVSGFFFAITAPYLTAQFLMPVLAVALLVIWALPDQRTVPMTQVRFLFSAYMICLVLWPNYLALGLPGLPWITLLRLTGVPMAIGLLICLSVSEKFRARLMEVLNVIPFIWKALTAFVVLQFVTIIFSGHYADSLNKALINQVNWTAIFLVSAYVFVTPGRIRRYLRLICFLAAPIGLMSFLEYHQQNILWVDHIPDFLKIEDAAKALAPEFRFGTGEYRSRTTFTTALGLAEYMALVTPYFIHLLVTGKTIASRISAAILLFVIYISIEFSGSRLGFMGIMISILLYTLLWALTRWRRLRADLFAPAILVAYPAFFVSFIGASFFIRRIHNMVWGGGESQGSNQARKDQLAMAFPKVLENPIGHGPGMSGDAMGYAANKFVTVDNYAITIALEYGVIGLIAFFGMFLAGMWHSARYSVLYLDKSRDPDAEYLVPLSVSMGVFCVIKIVFSQPDNHPIPFMMLGMIVALIYRLERERRAAETTPSIKGRLA